ncbi:ribbon-helix-helix domain-containing protein [Candidatus Poriferisocius sp.]|uniref:ribbon-helix-helix domain-containing protein n=1 Tax=Candidatus Poriferisocius sp. TaxID=3101276 RepID=UPI003B59DD93
MRTTVTLADDVAAAVQGLRREEGIGMSEAVNRLVRDGLARPAETPAYIHDSFDMGMKIDVTNVGEVLGMLDELELGDQQGEVGSEASLPV